VRHAKFVRFLAANKIGFLDLARRTGYSRQHLHRLRTGKQKLTPRYLEKLLPAVRQILRRRVLADEMFEPDELPELPTPIRKRSRRSSLIGSAAAAKFPTLGEDEKMSGPSSSDRGHSGQR
jgi:transcriptional regulator with XRE-family HTH domain